MNTDKKFSVSRRNLLKGLGAASLIPLVSACSSLSKHSKKAGKVVVIGGGFGGATAAKYLKRFNPALEVTLVEVNPVFYTCPFSNLVLAGERKLEAIAHNYKELKEAYGVEVIHAKAEDVDAVAHTVTLAGGKQLHYDRLVLSPGIDFQWNAIEGYDAAAAELVPHAWKAGKQTALLRQQLEAMNNGDNFVISVPENPFRCPPGPYERVSLVAHYLAKHKPKSKILILDAKDNFSKQGLFMEGWKELYGKRIEWISKANDGKVVRVDAKRKEVETEFGNKYKAGVLNVIPPQKAGIIAQRAGVTNAGGWVPVKPNTFEAELAQDIYVIGDASIAAPMPKSGFSANAQGKVVAAAIVASLAGFDPVNPTWSNTCYSLVGPSYGISVADVYRLENEKLVATPGGGVSPLKASKAFRKAEADYAHGWYAAIAQDTWGTSY